MSGAAIQVSKQTQARSEDSLITLMVRDPNWLYVYWDISEEKYRAFSSELGEELWKRSVPALKVVNVTKGESFLVRINDFSNNWYINVPDPNSIYLVEIGRKISENYFIGMSGSNSIVTPSDYVSPDTTACFADYTDVKSGKFEIRAAGIPDTFIYGNAAEGMGGPSSPWLYGRSPEEGPAGASSGAFYGMEPQELPGAGSDMQAAKNIWGRG